MRYETQEERATLKIFLIKTQLGADSSPRLTAPPPSPEPRSRQRGSNRFIYPSIYPFPMIWITASSCRPSSCPIVPLSPPVYLSRFSPPQISSPLFQYSNFDILNFLADLVLVQLLAAADFQACRRAIWFYFSILTPKHRFLDPFLPPSLHVSYPTSLRYNHKQQLSVFQAATPLS